MGKGVLLRGVEIFEKFQWNTMGVMWENVQWNLGKILRWSVLGFKNPPTPPPFVNLRGEGGLRYLKNSNEI